MITFSIIQKSQLEGAMRMDAEYYQPEYFIDFSIGSWKSIGDVIKNCQYGLSLAMNDENKGYPMFKMDDINDVFLVDDDVRYADVKIDELKNFELKYDDVLFNRVNSEEFVGRTGIFKLDRESVFASYLIRLQVDNNSEILADYLNIFLNSKFGLKQIKKYSRRAVNQANVNAEELKQFKIAVLPMHFQEEIGKLSDESWLELKNSKFLYQQAKKILLDELDLNDFEVENNLSAIVNFSEILEARRMDAEYFQGNFERILKVIKNKKVKIYSLKDASCVKRGSLVSPDFYNNSGRPYLRGKDFSSGKITKDGLVCIDNKFKPNNETTVRTGDIVFALIGSVGTLALVGEEFDNSFISNNVGKISITDKSEIIPDYLTLVLHSVVGQSQFEKYATRTAQPKISDDQIKSFIIPILPKETQQKIADLVRQSHEARKKSKELLEEAKRKVEEMIEKGGENA